MAATPAGVMSAAAPRDMGKASGANSTFQRFGSVFGVAVTTAVFAANGHIGTPASFTAGFRPALALAAGFSVLGAVSALAVVTRRRQPAVAPPAASQAVSLEDMALLEPRGIAS